MGVYTKPDASERVILRSLCSKRLPDYIPKRLHAFTATELSMPSVTSVRHADASVFQAIFGVELVAAVVVPLENPVYCGWRLDLRNSNGIAVMFIKCCMAEHGKSNQPQGAKQQP